jgi:hypothetical protein
MQKMDKNMHRGGQKRAFRRLFAISGAIVLTGIRIKMKEKGLFLYSSAIS